MNPEIQQLQEQLDRQKKDLEALTATFYLNNFYASQDFNKTCRFNTTLKVPHYSTAPSTTEIGQLIEVGGKLYISTAVNTFTLVGSQV
jgi:hypothetical protein